MCTPAAANVHDATGPIEQLRRADVVAADSNGDQSKCDRCPEWREDPIDRSFRIRILNACITDANGLSKAVLAIRDTQTVHQSYSTHLHKHRSNTVLCSA